GFARISLNPPRPAAPNDSSQAGAPLRHVSSLTWDEEDRCAVAETLTQAYGATVVAKGPVTYVATPSGATWGFRDGTPALATAGTGDVLAGIIAALMAQGLSAYDASRLGVTMHGLAGVDAARELTSICVTAADVIEHIPAAVRGIAGKEN
ncbi:MAG: hypothetical protein IJH83_08535, partial [Coriobacteriales bacterium]|nr:hypothetical protein [Coriobacteriales bacterium]